MNAQSSLGRHVINKLKISFVISRFWGFPGGSVVKNQPTLQEMWVRSLGEEDPLEDEMATHSSILARKIPWTEEPGGLQVMGRKET